MNGKKKNENRPVYRKLPFTESGVRKELEIKYYDNADMMQLFKVTARTLQRWRDEGIVPYKKLGGIIYYNAQRVDELMIGDHDDEENH